MSKMKTRDHSRIDYNVNSTKFGKAVVLPMTIKPPDDAIVPDIAPVSVEFPYVTINKNSDNLVVCKVKYDNHGKDIFEIRLVLDLLFSQSYFVKQLSDYIMLHIDESIKEHKTIKQHLDQFLQSLNTDIKVGDIVYFEDAASESNGLKSGYAIVTAKEESKENEDYKWNINMNKDLKIRAITTETEEQVEPGWVQNFTEFSISHQKCDLVVDHTKYEGGYKTVYVKLKYILEKEDKEKLELQINVCFLIPIYFFVFVYVINVFKCVGWMLNNRLDNCVIKQLEILGNKLLGVLDVKFHNKRKLLVVAWNATLYKYGLEPYLHHQHNLTIARNAPSSNVYSVNIAFAQMRRLFGDNKVIKYENPNEETGERGRRTYPKNCVLKWSHNALKLTLDVIVWTRYDK